jgi:UMF1 family MFS transporter
MDGEQTLPAGAAAAPAAPSGPATRLEIFGWCMFDFANSSYTTLILTVAFPVYFVSAVAGGAGLTERQGNLFLGLSSAVSQGLVVLTAPVLGAIADFAGAKKRILLVTYLGCVAGTAALGLIGPGDLALAILLFVVSALFYSSGENVVAAFLPEIAPPEKLGRVSGLGWALGYMGGLGSLFACYPFLRHGVGPDNATSVRLSFLVVAAFFFLGGLPTFLFLRERSVKQPLPPGKGYVAMGFARTLETLRRIRRYRQLFRFLAVFLVYGAGISIAVLFSTVYGKQVLGMSMGELTLLFIILQVSASAGALAFGLLQDRLSSKMAIQLSLFLWILACAGAFLTTSKNGFYVVGNFAGLAMGSSQSSARALVGSFSPGGRNGEFFGFWGLSWKLSAVIGPPVFSAVQHAFDMRIAILVTGLFFLAGMIGMLFIDEEEGKRAARAGDGGQGPTKMTTIRGAAAPSGSQAILPPGPAAGGSANE